MNAAFDVVDWDVHLVRQVLARAGKPLSAKTIQAQADLCLESTYAALVRMHESEAVRIVGLKGGMQAGRKWELMNAPA
jgi:hypothetical protein